MDEISMICIKPQRSTHIYSIKVLADIRLILKMTHLTVKKLVILFFTASASPQHKFRACLFACFHLTECKM